MQIIDIGYSQLLYCLFFVLFAGLCSVVLHLQLHREILWGTIRTFAQLFLMGYILKYVFQITNAVPILILYPMWGIIQQYLMLGIVTNGLLTIFQEKKYRYVIIFLVSFFFSLIHSPSYFLMIFTFFMELVFITVYFKWRNLWAIGIAHGWIAIFLLYYVLERDLWTELFQWF